MLSEAGVLTVACHVHWKSAQLMGVLSFQFALSAISYVMVMPEPVPPVVGVVPGVVLPVVPGVVPGVVVLGAAVVLVLLSLPHAATTRARPTASAAILLLLVVLTDWSS